MKIILLFILIFQFSHVNADEIYNLIKIPNLEIYKLKNENNIRYLNAKGDFKIGVNDNITCNAVLPDIIDTPINRENMTGENYNSWTSPSIIANKIETIIKSKTNGQLILV